MVLSGSMRPSARHATIRLLKMRNPVVHCGTLKSFIWRNMCSLFPRYIETLHAAGKASNTGSIRTEGLILSTMLVLYGTTKKDVEPIPRRAPTTLLFL